MADFGPDEVFCPNFQIAISQEPLGVRSWEFSYFNDTYKWCKNDEINRGKGVMPWMIWYETARWTLSLQRQRHQIVWLREPQLC